MSKSFTFVIVVVTLDILLSIFGMIDTGTSALLQAINFSSGSGFAFGELFTAIFGSTNGLFALGAATAAIIAGLYFRGEGESALMAGIVSIIGGWVIADMVMIIAQASTMFVGELAFLATVIRIVMSILLTGFVIAIISYWKGSD